MWRQGVVEAVMLAVVCSLAGCVPDGGTGTPDAGDAGLPPVCARQPPADANAVTFAVDDRANRVFADGDLEWVAEFDGQTLGLGRRTLVLHDDGPWSCGGSEPEGADAGDHVWGAIDFYISDYFQNYQYGVRDLSVQPSPAWVGRFPLGIFRVEKGAGRVTVPTLVLPAFGQTDLTWVVDTAALAPGGWVVSAVGLEGSAWYWTKALARDDGQGGDATPGDGRFSLALSSLVGPGKAQPHPGLLHPGDVAGVRVTLAGQPYQAPDGGALLQGLSASARTGQGAVVPLTVTLAPDGASVQVTIP